MALPGVLSLAFFHQFECLGENCMCIPQSSIEFCEYNVQRQCKLFEKHIIFLKIMLSLSLSLSLSHTHTHTHTHAHTHTCTHTHTHTHTLTHILTNAYKHTKLSNHVNT